MQRTLLTLAVATALILLVLAGMIGLRTALPDLSLADETAMALPDGLGPIHAAVGTFFAAIVAAASATVAQREDGPLAGLVLALSGLIALVAILGAVLLNFQIGLTEAILESQLLAGDRVQSALRLDLLSGCSLGLILLAAGCLVGARPGYRWLGAFVQFLTAAIFAVHVFEIATGGAGTSAFLVLIPLLTLLALFSAQLADEDVPAAPYLFAMMLFGLIVTVIAGLGPAMGGEADPTEVTTEDWLGFLAFVVPFFGLFAALNRAAPGQHGAWIWVHALGLVVLALPSMGQMTGAADAAPAAARWGFVFYGWVFLGLTVDVRRSVRRSIARASG